MFNMMTGQKTAAAAPPLALEVAEAKVAAMENGEPTTTHVAMMPISTKTYSHGSNVLQVTLRLLCIASSVMAFSFMVTANESGFASLYGFKLPIHSNWSYSYSYEYLVAISAAAAAHSLLQFFISGSRLLRRAPLIPSRSQAWIIFAGDQALAYAMLSAGSAASGVSNLNRTGIKHTPLPNFCKPLKMFCGHVAVSLTFTFIGSLLLAASAVHDVIWLSKN